MVFDYLIVGAGFAGSVLAERLASQLDKNVLLIDRRTHIGGNAYDSTNEDGIRIHHYGPHLFHTNDEAIFSYLSRFTNWRPYEHHVNALVHGKLVPMPINRRTVNDVLGQSFETEQEVEDFFQRERSNLEEINNSKDFVVSRVGERLYKLLYKGYSSKHWGIDPSRLAPSVLGRLPVRSNLDDRYFEDRFQAVPIDGYTKMFQHMLSHPNIEVRLETGYKEIQGSAFDKLIYTGPIDEYFDFIHGRLPYRSLRFEFETFDQEQIQPVAQINYPLDFEYTRTVEFKHITGQQHLRTTISKEYSIDRGEPYYPIPTEANQELYRLYRKEAGKLQNVHFAGRLATYKYYNMDQIVAQALALFNRLATEV